MASPRRDQQETIGPRTGDGQVLVAILAELKAIRTAVEKPRQTIERESAEFLASLSR